MKSILSHRHRRAKARLTYTLGRRAGTGIESFGPSSRSASRADVPLPGWFGRRYAPGAVTRVTPWGPYPTRPVSVTKIAAMGWGNSIDSSLPTSRSLVPLSIRA